MYQYNKATPTLFYERLSDGFLESALGFRLTKKKEFKEYARKFAVAAQKVQKNYAFIKPEDGEWQNRLDFEQWILTQKAKEWLDQFVCLDCE